MLKVGRIVKLWTIIAASDPAMSTVHISHAACLSDETGKYYRESPQRLYAIDDAPVAAGRTDRLDRHDAPRASRPQVFRVYSCAYLEVYRP